MSPRRRPPRAEPRPAGGDGWLGQLPSQQWDGRGYVVRQVSGPGANKPYRCPGCDQEIRIGQPHLVVWPADEPGADDRRHWHTACWRARDRRTPGVQRSRNAPRYGRGR